jgi:hypothetical protein
MLLEYKKIDRKVLQEFATLGNHTTIASFMPSVCLAVGLSKEW